MSEEFVSAEPFAPGEYLQDDLDALGWTREHFAGLLGWNVQQVESLIEGTTAVTPEIAESLERIFGSSATVWLNLQSSYERSLAAAANR